MKKLFKYLAIGILIIIGIFIGISAYMGMGKDRAQYDIDNFFSIPGKHENTIKQIKMVETYLDDSLQNKLNKLISKLENKYPNNSEVKSLRISLNKAIVLQKKYAINWKKDLNEKLERERKLKEAKTQQNIKSNKKIAISAVCNNRGDINIYFNGMENARLSDAIRHINKTPGCYLGIDAKSDADIFTINNSTLMSKGNFEVILFNGKKWGVTSINAYQNP